MNGVRLAAARALLAVLRGRTTLAAEIENARASLTDRRDRGLLLELAAGTLRWQNEVDAVISAASQRAASQIDPVVLTVLRLAVFQLRHLERVPAHAVVHESVDVIRELDAPAAAGFVNAVLRGVLRRGPAIALPKRPGTDNLDAQVRYLTTTLSHPAWLVRRWIHRYGFDAAETWCAFNNTAPGVSLRPVRNIAALDLVATLAAAGVPATPSGYVRDAIRLPPGALGTVPPELRDDFQIQDEGAQLVARYANARPGERILDACAAPGGKTLVLAHDLGASASSLVAADHRASRVDLLARTLARAGAQASVVALDARAPLPFSPVFDCVVLDVPCSGLGTLRRDPDLKWSRAESDLPRLAADALCMLEQAAAIVVPGGRIVYATCSCEPEENGQVVDAFLSRRSGFERSRPDASADVSPGVLTADGSLVTTPFQHGLDAFFAATVVRRQSA